MPTPRPQPECSAPRQPPLPACASHQALRSLLSRTLTPVSVLPATAATMGAALHWAQRRTGRRERITTAPVEGLVATTPYVKLQDVASADVPALDATTAARTCATRCGLHLPPNKVLPAVRHAEGAAWGWR